MEERSSSSSISRVVSEAEKGPTEREATRRLERAPSDDGATEDDAEDFEAGKDRGGGSGDDAEDFEAGTDCDEARDVRAARDGEARNVEGGEEEVDTSRVFEPPKGAQYPPKLLDAPEANEEKVGAPRVFGPPNGERYPPNVFDTPKADEGGSTPKILETLEADEEMAGADAES